MTVDDATGVAPTAGDRRWPAACTIIAANYLSHARILIESYTRHHPGANFYLLVVDRLPDGASVGGGAHLVDLDELGLPYLAEMRLHYTVTELSTALKSSFLSFLLDTHGEDAVIYLDPDILVCRPFAELQEVLTSKSIVLTPHLLHPLPNDGLETSERAILIAGTYNLGFIAVRRSDETCEFLRWWEDHLREECLVDPSRGLMVDQKWINLAPHLFPASVASLRDDTYNVAYWNISSRTIDRDEQGQFLVNGNPLTFFHFSGFDPRSPRNLSKHQNRTQVVEGTPLADLLDLYAGLQMEHGFDVSSSWQYGNENLVTGSFDNGVPGHPILRQLYLDLDPEERTRFGDPLRTVGSDAFFTWATAPRPEEGRLSRFLEAVYQQRPDLAAVFPDPAGLHQEGFLTWARIQGTVEYGYDPRLVPAELDAPEARSAPAGPGPIDETPSVNGSASVAGDPTEGAVTRLVETSSDPALRPDRATGSDGAAKQRRLNGVNVSGYLRTGDGLGAVARGHIGALRALGVPIARNDLSALNANALADQSIEPFDDDNPYDVNLVCVNADQHFEIKRHLGEEYFQGRHNIGAWFWELPSFPRNWHDRFADYDEIWVATSFVANTLGPVSPIPVVRIPPVLIAGGSGSRERGRQRLSLSDDELVFLYTFNFRSYFERKNPLAVVEAFQAAFAPTDPVRLVIKCSNGETSRQHFADLIARAEGYPIAIYDEHWTAEEMRDLTAACDAYVSLHRSEGFGLTIADAMALGKPVIATSWSGNSDFMNVGNSFPVRYRLVEIADDVGPYHAGGIWADPSVEHAAELMRLIFENRDEAAARGRAAKREIATHFSEERVALLMHQRLAVIAGRRQAATSRSAPSRIRVDHAGLEAGLLAAESLISDAFDNGVPGHPILRQLYLDLDPDARTRFGDPLQAAGPDAFFAWATAPRPEEGRLSRFLEAIYRQRPDLITDFPDPAGPDQNAFLTWARTHGAAELGYDPRLVCAIALADRIREVARLVLPRDAGVIVASEGDNELPRLGNRRTWAFLPVTPGGVDSAFPDVDTAIARLDALRTEGAEFLLIPGDAYHQFGQITGFRRHLEDRHARLWEDKSCVIYQLASIDDRLQPRALPVINAHLFALDRARRRLRTIETSGGAVEARVEALIEEAARSSARIEELGQALEQVAAEAARASSARIKELAERLVGQEARVEALLKRAARSRARIEELAERQGGQEARIEERDQALTDVTAGIARLDYRFAARPYMTADIFGALGDLDQPMGYTSDLAAPLGIPDPGLRFSDVFRGSEDFIMERQRPYLPFLDGLSRVVDLGCGRGEFLRLLRDRGVPGVGVELEASLVASCRAQGLQVVEGDALDYLRQQESGSLEAVFSAQVIERLTLEERLELLALAKDRLREGGVFIAETVNPESFEALKTFDVDPKHQAPIFPQVLLFECREAGYRSARIFYPTAGGFTQRSYQTAGEYAVIAVV